ncbi:hypothetical protein BCR33DRAFT_847262 [Rhizoclosmatium globosum]|uniref:ABC transporter domain-containing protein n=1 Tax=Rhizoclosmatium globosum TaxID=329046 RepID=A0A1Y2CSI2_9FUNG|nr:hypothetical protein BCR33DRAFT_847262 [Rhizoclosmatium globosum]|eukprot:ORY50030.1 hypothetical protein BCR33DRAFT_847262 [Rhizoclosmatium globosum]
MATTSPLSLESFAAQYNITLPKIFPNPFYSEGERTLGQPWTLGKLPISVPKELGPGFGCFEAPYVPVGFELDITDNNTLPLTIGNACKPGFFCPFLDITNPATYPVQCPPSAARSVRAHALPSGFYCPDYKTVTVCPEGHYCLSGQTAPTPCEFLSFCSAGTIIQQHYGFAILVAVVDVFLVAIFLVLRQREKRRINKLEESQENKKALTTEDIQRNISALTAGFHKGLEGLADLQMNYDFDDLSLTLPDGKSILQGVSGSINAGKMTAIMGPSGAGKTTFMNVLMGKAARTAGTLKINGTVAEMASFKKLIELSVRENIRYSARVRLPNSWTNAEVDAHVEAILQALKGISGGQRKRVNIGMELAALHFLFSSTNHFGLDSTAAMDAVNILHSISRLGLTLLRLFTNPRGRTAFFGPVSGAKPYFESLGFYFRPTTNVADTLMDILAGRGELNDGIPETLLGVSEITAKWKVHASLLTTNNTKASNSSIDSMNTLVKHRGAAIIRQVGLAHNRYLAQQSRLVGGFVLECLNGLAAGAIMGVASLEAWFIAMYGMLIGIAISLAAAPAGVNVTTAYFIGKNLSVIPRIVFSSAHFFALYYYLAQPPIAIGIQFALLFLNFFGIYGMGMFISMIISQQNAPLIAVTVGLISEVLCGFGPSLSTATADGYVFILNIGLNRWAAEAQFWEWAKPYEKVFDEYLLSYSYGYQKGNTVKNMIIMFALGFAYRLIAYVFLLFVLKAGYFRGLLAVFRPKSGKKTDVAV